MTEIKQNFRISNPVKQKLLQKKLGDAGLSHNPSPLASPNFICPSMAFLGEPETSRLRIWIPEAGWEDEGGGKGLFVGWESSKLWPSGSRTTLSHLRLAFSSLVPAWCVFTKG